MLLQAEERMKQRIITIIGQRPAIKDLEFLTRCSLKFIDSSIEPVRNDMNSLVIQCPMVSAPVAFCFCFISEDDGLCILEQAIESSPVGQSCPRWPFVREGVRNQGPRVTKIEHIGHTS